MVFMLDAASIFDSFAEVTYGEIGTQRKFHAAGKAFYPLDVQRLLASTPP
jgi:hypothetical protein